MRKPAFCKCENNDADQLRGNREADQRLCFRYIDSTMPLLSKSEILKFLVNFCGSTARFVSALVGNPEDRFSHNEAHIIIIRRNNTTKSRAIRKCVIFICKKNRIHTCVSLRW